MQLFETFKFRIFGFVSCLEFFFLMLKRWKFGFFLFFRTICGGGKCRVSTFEEFKFGLKLFYFIFEGGILKWEVFILDCDCFGFFLDRLDRGLKLFGFPGERIIFGGNLFEWFLFFKEGGCEFFNFNVELGMLD